MLLFFHAHAVDECGHGGFGKGAGHTLDGRIFLVKERARIGGEFKRIAKDKILIVVKDLVFLEIANRNGRDDRHLIDAGTALAIEQNARKAKIADRAFEHRIGTDQRTLNLEAIAAPDDLSGDRVGKARFDPVAKSFCLKLKCRNRNRF